MPFYHARLPVYSWMSGPLTTNMYQFDGHAVCIGTGNRWDKKVYASLSLFWTPLSGRGLAYCSTSYASFPPSHLQLPNFLTYSPGHVQEMQSKNLDDFILLIYVLCYLDKFVVDCG